jgi:hypothetical protein
MTTLNERTEQRAVIQICAESCMTQTDKWKFMKQNDGIIKCYRTLVFDCHKRFREGWADIKVNARGGRPGNDARLMKYITNVLSTDRRKSLDDVADIVGIIHGTVHKIVTQDLNIVKVCARWVPRLLT